VSARIVIPPKRRGNPDYGIIVSQTQAGKPTFRLTFREDGIKRTFLLRDAKTIEQARELRDIFYKNLRRKYDVTTRVKLGRPARPGRKGIYYRKPWYVKIDGKQIGEFDTEAEAKQAKAAYLKNR
jgi:hypothetical protein